MMSRIRGRDTRMEVRLRSMLWRAGARYRKHPRIAGCRPDFAFIGSRVVVFLDGCFWHGCPDHFVRPRTRTKFWLDKIRANVERDRRQTLRLESEGWCVLRFWEHGVDDHPEVALSSILRTLRSARRSGTPVSGWRVREVEEMPGNRERWTLQDLRDPALRVTRIRTRSPRKARVE